MIRRDEDLLARLDGALASGILTPELAEQFREALDDAGISNEIVVYDGAPHSFFDRTAEEHAEAAEDAWRRMLEFIRSNSPDSEEE